MPRPSAGRSSDADTDGDGAIPIDAARGAKGQYLLTGSQNLLLSKNISETLAGRTAVLKLLPLRGVQDLNAFQSFLQMLASRSAQLLDLASLARDLGVSANTVKAWLSVLEATYQVILLRPYFANIGKRLVETPGGMIPLEIKASASPRPEMARAIEVLRADLGDAVREGFVVHGGEQLLPLGEGTVALPLGML